ncbi:MAG: hypothetical protein ACRD1Y_03465 [Terriglobales bacterium]
MTDRLHPLSLALAAVLALSLVRVTSALLPHAPRQASSALCPSNSTVLSMQGDCGGYDLYIVGYNDVSGYHVVDPADMVLTGCSGGHLVCNGGPCKFLPQQVVHAPPPRFIADQQTNQVFWDDYDISHSVADMGCGANKQNCYQDVNQEIYVGRVGYQSFNCTPPPPSIPGLGPGR